ncbi:hypothetical protein [Methanohalophilus sp.]
MEEQVDLAAYGLAVSNFIALLGAVTDLGIVKVDLILAQDGYESLAGAGSNVDVGATFSGLLAAGNGKRASIKLPGITASFVDPDASVPIVGDIAAWLAEFETAGPMMLSDGETVETWVRGTLDK